MSEKDLHQNLAPGESENGEPKMFVNDYGTTRDSAVAIDEADRTVLLTEDETIVIQKEPRIDLAPKNRPRKVYGGMWGQTEIATTGGAFLAILAVILVYIFLVVPSNRESERNRAERDRLEKELMSARDKYGNITSVETRVAELISSVDYFETTYLPVAETGKTALYQRINGLISSYGLVNTTGPDYAPLELADQTQNNQAEEERGKSKYRSLFPGVYVTTTVEGTYHNLRRFIRDVETGQEFVVISAVELSLRSRNRKKARPARPLGQTFRAAATQLIKSRAVTRELIL